MHSFLVDIYDYLRHGLAVAVMFVLFVVVVLVVIDVSQTANAVRRKYPVRGRCRP